MKNRIQLQARTSTRPSTDWALLALPRESWREISGGCCCIYCSADGKPVRAFWDAATIEITTLLENGEAEYGFCHAPEVHGQKPKR
jgi:hypothetical protein